MSLSLPGWTKGESAQCQAQGGTGACGAAGRAGLDATDPGALEKPSSSDPSFMGDINPSLGCVLAVLPALDHPHRQGRDGGSGIPSPAGTGNSFSSLAPLLHHRPGAGGRSCSSHALFRIPTVFSSFKP